MTRHRALSLCLLLALGWSACAENGYETAANGGGAASIELPDFAGIALLRDTAFTDSDRTRLGKDYDPALPSSNVSANGNVLTFSPTVESPGSSLADFAFALYRFSLPGYGDNAAVRCNWTGPAPEGRSWLALANREQARWDWLPMGADGRVDFNSLLPYIEADNLLLAIVVGGNEAAELASIVIGDNAVPSATITADPDSGTVPLTVEFSGAQSTDSDGSILKYEWDFDGDGVYDLDSGADLDVSHTYTETGSYAPRLRVTDDKGAQSTDVVNVSVNDPAMVPPVADLTADPETGPRPLQVTLDASGSTDDIGVLNYDFDFTGDGEYDIVDSPDPVAVYTYSNAGIYTAVVRVEDSDGATDTASVQIDSDAPAEADLWNVTPLCGGGQRTLSAYGYEEGGTIVQYRWDFEDDGTWDQTTTAAQVTHSYSFGTYYPRVEVTDDDGDIATDTFTYGVSVQEWSSTGLPAGGTSHAGPSVAQIAGNRIGVFEWSGGIQYWGPTPHSFTTSNPPDTSVMKLGYTSGSGGQFYPFVVYYTAGGDLRIARGNFNPDAEADWDIHTIRDSSDSFDGDYTLDAVSYGSGTSARIAVSYYDDEDNQLGFAFSENSEPNEGSDWTRHAVDSDGNAGKYHALALFGGRPAIVYQNIGSSASSAQYARAAVAEPDAAGDWSFHALLNAGGTNDPFRGFSMASVGGKPALTMAVGTSGRLYYYRATVAEPTQLSHWHSHQPAGDVPTGGYTALGEFSGRPVIGYSRTDVVNPVLKYAVGRTPTPSSGDDWCFGDVAGLSGINGFDIALGNLNGKPLFGLYTDILDTARMTLAWGL